MAELEPALREGQKAVIDFLAHCRSVGPDRWEASRAPGKWSPAHVADHVAVSYEASCAMLRGEGALKGMPRWLRPLIRVLFLNRVLKTGRFPKGAKSPKAFEPATNPAPAAENLRRLEKAAADFESEVRRRDSAGDATIDHPVFGRIRVADYVRLNAIHTRHHEAQLG